MDGKIKCLDIKRGQLGYPTSFKLGVVQEIERGELSVSGASRKYGIHGHSTVLRWCRKFGTFDRETVVRKMNQEKTQRQRIFELERENERLRRQNAFLQQEVEDATDKAGILDMIIRIAEEELKVPIRKKSSPGQSKGTPKGTRKR